MHRKTVRKTGRANRPRQNDPPPLHEERRFAKTRAVTFIIMLTQTGHHILFVLGRITLSREVGKTITDKLLITITDMRSHNTSIQAQNLLLRLFIATTCRLKPVDKYWTKVHLDFVVEVLSAFVQYLYLAVTSLRHNAKESVKRGP